MALPLVFVPDMMCDARVFLPQIIEISRDRPVMVAPIHCADTIDNLARHAITALPPECAIAGMGLGSAVAMEVLRRAPDRICKIALISSFAQAETPGCAAEREEQIVLARAGRLDDAVGGALQLEHLAPGLQRAAILDTVQDMARTLGADSFIRQSRAMQRRHDQQRTLRTTKIPAVVICGALDSMTPIRRHQIIADLMPNADLQVIENAGHLPTLEAPQETTAALQEWLGAPLLLT